MTIIPMIMMTCGEAQAAQGGKAWREFEGPRPNGRRAYKSVPAVIISNITSIILNNMISSIIIIYE